MKANDPLKIAAETKKKEISSSVPKKGTAAYADWLDEQVRKFWHEADWPLDKDGNPIKE